ncbi:MAG: hypothetical protein FWD92_04220 [Methanomassiliicoccaceae archaeon]|nr:hypothetical protein [Methanomassiliicoccaceae archaeon]
MRNRRYESFGAGRAGQGQIDLQSGEVVFVHNDTSSDSNVLPISVSHVYSTSSALNADGSVAYGKGFNLNLYKRLQKVSEDPNDTRYILTDAAGKEYEFKKLYYYLNSEGRRVYHRMVGGEEVKFTPGDISIGHDRKLTYHDGTETHEIFTELRTDSGFVLVTELKDFLNAHKIETRHEELIQLEDEVRSLGRSIEDLEFSLEEYKKLDHEDLSELRKKQTDIQKKSFEIEEDIQESFKALKKCQDGLIKKNSEYNNLITKNDSNIGRLRINSGNAELQENVVASGNLDGLNPNYSFVFERGRSRRTFVNAIGREMERLSLLASYDKIYTEDYYGKVLGNADTYNGPRIERVIQFLQERFEESIEKLSQDIREDSFKLEKKRWEDQKTQMKDKEELLNLQIDFQELKDGYDNDERIRLRNRYDDLTKRAEIDIAIAEKMLDYRKFVLRQYEEQVSVNFISDRNGLNYGFNRAGHLVIIWDAYDNHASLIYEDGKLMEINDAEEKDTVFEYIGGKLSVITDALDRKTRFVYTGDHLEKIIYPNGDESSFAYRNGLLYEMVPPVGIGKRLEYDHENRPVKIVNATSVESVSFDGIIKNNETETEDVVGIEYGESGKSTGVSDLKTGHRTNYLFNSEGDCVTEYAELDDVMRIIRTYDVGRRRCYFSMQQTDFDNNLIDHAVPEQNNPNVIHSLNGDVNIGNIDTLDRFAVWNLDPHHLPEHATDLILSGFATADSDETTDRRKTEYCDHSDPNHPHASPVTDPAAESRRFELRAEITYRDESTNVSEKKTFIASYDWRIKTKQFVAIPITLNENGKGEPIKPLSIRITADYSNNRNTCLFSRISLADGDWIYTEMDEEHRKIFECSNRQITDRTVDGVKVGRFVSHDESFFEYDRKGNLIRERTVLTKDGISETHVTKREYNKRSKIIRTTLSNGIVSETVYDKRGNAVRSFTYHKSNPASRFVQENEYNEKGQITAEIDARGENRTIFEYLDGTNIITRSISPNGQRFSIGINPHTDELLAISASAQGELNETEFVHTKGLLTRLTSGGTHYDYSYDSWGRKSEISIAGTPHVQYALEMSDGNGGNSGNDGNETVTATYANGEQYQTTTDRFGKLLTVHRIINGVRTLLMSNHYDGNDRLIETTDHLAKKVARFIYNDDGSLNTEISGNVQAVKDHNIEGSVERVRYVLEEGIDDQAYENIYDDEGRVSQIILPNGRSETIEYDSLGRISAIEHPTHREQIKYYQNGNATGLITSTDHGNGRTKYAYDSNGNISEIRENGRLSVRYSYDGLDRISREDNIRLNKSTTFDYDTNGNIRFKNIYPLSDSIELTYGEEIRYDYAETGNRDRLTAINGEVCEYDILGNPVKYRNNDLEWSNLRDLVQYDNTRFEYDVFGLRQSKSCGETKTEFYWSGSKLLAEKRISAKSEDLELDDHLTDDPMYSNATNMSISYLQGAGGLAGFIISRKDDSCKRSYYYRKNIQGDITHIFDDEGTIKAEYVYDAWGNHEIIEDGDKIGSVNPYRYRGYYYDVETKLYYLRTRYYDPETGRFISADDIAIFHETQTHINGLNLYAYCANNPIMFADPTGQIFRRIRRVIQSVGNVIDSVVNWIDDNATLIIAVLIVCVVVAVTVATFGAAAPLAVALGAKVVGGKVISAMTAKVISGVVVGAVKSATMAAGKSIISQGLSNNGYRNIDWGTVGTAALIGGATGAVSGGASKFLGESTKLSRVGYQIGGEAIISGGSTAVKGLLTDSFSWTDVGVSAFFGAAGGRLGPKTKNVHGDECPIRKFIVTSSMDTAEKGTNKMIFRISEWMRGSR